VTVRLYRAGDEPGLCGLWTDVFGYPEARNAPARVLEQKLRWDDRLLVAERAGQVLGSLMLGYDGHRGWLYRLAVTPSARRCGLGRALVREAERLLAEIGCPKINLQLHADNEAGASFWAALGYGREPRISMGKDLSGPPCAGDSGC
jgi:ribosomal protein S18 acetylase RimI-like enzyme